VRALAVLAPQRAAQLPNVPTAKESNDFTERRQPARASATPAARPLD
jgi:tripartite-type tricarboxylate transporter receptor subunit TctC